MEVVVTQFDHAYKNFETNVVHAGRPRPNIEGAVVTPIFQSANYLQSDEKDYGSVRYVRLSNSPNHHVLHARLAVLESAEAALVAASGMAAIASTILAFAHAGDHVIAHDNLYGGMQNWFEHDGPQFGISCTRIDGKSPGAWDAAVRPQSKILYLESITNPMMEVLDLEAAVRFAKQRNLISIIDNTFTSPFNFRPHEMGIDLVVHSATKYLNGHSDIAAGAVAGSQGHVSKVLRVLNHMGGSLDPHACFLLERGMKTLALRMERHNANALKLARALSGHPKVRKVNYPGLETDPGYKRARQMFSGCGGMLSFYTHTADQAERFIGQLQIPLHAASLGGVESLVVRPARSSHLDMTPEARAKIGVTDELVRVSVGIESADEIVADFKQALDAS
jgi:cystathionine beta-lyase/cystathionine gamma-synthase